MLLHEVFAAQMKNQPYGHAVYHPASTQVLKPGACGYFNHLGQWNPVADLTNSVELSAEGYSACEQLKKAEKTPPVEWGPKCSQSVRRAVLDVSVGGSAFPTDLKAFYEFSSVSEYGAILLTTPPITREGYYGAATFLQWCRANKETLLQKNPEICDYDLWIVTETHSTPYCSINASVSKTKQIRLGFKAKLVSTGEIGPSGEWYHDHADEGWLHHGKKPTENPPKDTLGDDHKIANKKHGRKAKKTVTEQPTLDSNMPDIETSSKSEPDVVVFFSGFRFRYRKNVITQFQTLEEQSHAGKSNACYSNFVTLLWYILFILLTIATGGLFLLIYFTRYRRRRNRADSVAHMMAPETLSHTQDHNERLQYEPYQLAYPNSENYFNETFLETFRTISPDGAEQFVNVYFVGSYPPESGS